MNIKWTVVLAFYNEADFIEATLDTWARQTVPFRFVLVDNASTDNSAELCRARMAQYPGIAFEILDQPLPGHPHALEMGTKVAQTEFIALADADTIYPPDYLAKAEALLAKPDAMAAFAIDLYGDPDNFSSRLRKTKFAVVTRLLSKQCHTGSYGQCFRADIFHAVGGISPSVWPYVLHDHEIAQRILHKGRIIYDTGFWCLASDRRTVSASVRWSLGERLMYHFLPFRTKDWFFYSFLAPRFEERGLSFLNIRERDW
ncbi:MAG: glycosyltransferase family A protein [Novosphingobium sp.]